MPLADVQRAADRRRPPADRGLGRRTSRRESRCGAAPALSEQAHGALSRCAVATVSAELRKRGYPHSSIDGVHPLTPGMKMIGLARTLRFVAHRPDLFDSHGGGYNAQKRAFDSLEAGEVLVIEARGDATAGTVGDVLALRAKTPGRCRHRHRRRRT